MPLYKVVTTLPYVTGLPEDVAQFGLYCTGSNVAAAGEFAARVQDFLNESHGVSFTKVADRISRVVDRSANACRQDIYLMPGAAGPTGSPVETGTFTLDDTDGSAYNLPTEVAVCMSFRSDYGAAVEESGATRPRARHRGRIYLGPLNTNASDQAAGVTDPPRPNDNTCDVITDSAAAELGTAGATDFVWVQFSQTDWTSHAVERVWVDNEFDTQRRRGNKANARVEVVL